MEQLYLVLKTLSENVDLVNKQANNVYNVNSVNSPYK